VETVENSFYLVPQDFFLVKTQKSLLITPKKLKEKQWKTFHQSKISRKIDKFIFEMPFNRKTFDQILWKNTFFLLKNEFSKEFSTTMLKTFINIVFVFYQKTFKNS